MNYVIWGCGRRGKNILNFIGSEKVSAFIDSSPKVIGTEKYGIKVISFENYLKYYSDCIVIISPYYGHFEIEEILESHKIEYFSSFNFPSEVIETHTIDLYDIIKNKLTGKPVFLYGFNAYSMIILEHFRNNNGMDIKIIPSPKDSSSLMHLVKKIFPEYFAVADSCVGRTTYVTNKKYLKDEAIKSLNVENLYDFLYDIKEYYNPKLECFKNIHKGQRCFIVCTGPSLRVSDLNKLAENEDICISMNGIFKIYNSTKWRPNYLLIEDIVLFAEYKHSLIKSEFGIENMIVSDCALESDEYDNYIKSNIAKHTAESVFDSFDSKEYDKFIKCHVAKNNVDINAYPDFSMDISRGVYTSHTVAYMCLQFAFYLGCTEIYIIGADFNYDNKYNHFIKDYRSKENGKDIRYITDNLTKMKLGYETAKKKANELGIIIKNASRQSKLDVFERVNFDSLF